MYKMGFLDIFKNKVPEVITEKASKGTIKNSFYGSMSPKDKQGQPSPHDIAANGPEIKMTFGKYKDKEIRKIPIWYRKWMLENIKWTPFNKSIHEELLRLKEIGI